VTAQPKPQAELSPRQLEVDGVAKNKKGKHEQRDAEAQVPSSAVTQDTESGAPPKMGRKDYERQMRILHGELVAMQEWVKESGAKVCVVFEGRDTAGKGGTIKRITERVSPRVFRVELAPAWEKAMTESGILLLKYWLEVGPAEQTRRLEARINDPRKVWKLSAMDLKSYSRWYDYSRARDAMFAVTDTAWAPWYVADADDKKRARLNIISHLLSQVPYKPLPRQDVTLPKRQPPRGYVQPALPVRHIPTPF
jgi:polyphosphate kinase 2 (PPK2 family)